MNPRARRLRRQRRLDRHGSRVDVRAQKRLTELWAEHERRSRAWFAETYGKEALAAYDREKAKGGV